MPDTYILLILFSFIVIVATIAILRDIFFVKKESYRRIHTVENVNGKRIVECMLQYYQIDPVSIRSGDYILQRYYYSPRRREIVMSSHACYGSGIYEILRAANLSSHVVQQERAYKSIDIYLWLAPFYEIWVRIVPLFYILFLFLAAIFTYDYLYVLLALYAVTVLIAVFMLPIELNASDISCQWLEEHCLVAETDREQLREVSRYVSKYNLVCALTSLFAAMNRRKFVYHSDVSV